MNKKSPVKVKSSRKRKWKIFGVTVFCLFGMGAAGGYVWWTKKLEEAQAKLPKLESYRSVLSSSPSQILSADSKPVVLWEIAAEKRLPVKYDNIPKRVIYATLAAEDKRFYDHGGIDTWSVLRALVTNAQAGAIRGGGSTITMQLAKRVYTDSKVTFKRKVDDAAMAIQIERHYSKNTILEMYLNQVYYGNQAYGIAKAADVYFGKKLEQLTWGQAAALARCVQRPSRVNPIADVDAATSARNDVLSVMRDEKMITDAEYRQAKAEDLGKQVVSQRSKSNSMTKKAPYFVDYILDEVSRRLPNIDLSQGGYRIQTTINYDMQKVAEREVKELVDDYRSVQTGAFLLTDREGRIQAMVGGVDYDRNQFNFIANGKRQPGSSFKPFIYALAFDSGAIGPHTSLSNEPPDDIFDPVTRRKWVPKNSDGTVGGSMDVYNAFIFSKNLPAIDTLRLLGPRRFTQRAASAFGFVSEMPAVPSLALGTAEVTPLELAGAYSVFQNSGERRPAYGLVSVEGPDGQTIKSFVPDPQASGLRKTTLEFMDYLMRGVINEGTATRGRDVRNARGKTGTTNDNRDAWFCGYSDELLGIGWISGETKDSKGRWSYPEMNSTVFGGTVTIQMWRGIMRECQQMISEERAPKPTYSFWGQSSPNSPNRRRSRERDAEPSAIEEPDVEPGPDGDITPVEPDPNVEDPSTTPASNPNRDRPRDRERERPTNTDEGGAYETVYVCPDSGLLASSSCPEQRPMRYRRGDGPRRYCRKDHGGG